MSSVILQTSARPLLWLMLGFSVYVLLRGHNEPGGGFIGGLFAAAGFAVYAIAFGRGAAERLMRATPKVVLAIGLLLATLSGIPAVLAGEPYLTHLWWFPDVGFKLPIGTALLFDLGVYLTVLGSIAAFVFELMED